MNRILVQLLIIAGIIVALNSCELEGSCPTRYESFFTKFELPDSVQEDKNDTIKTIVWPVDCMSQINMVAAQNKDTFSMHAVITYNLCDCPVVEADTNCLFVFNFENKGKYIFRYYGVSENDTIRIMQDSIVVY